MNLRKLFTVSLCILTAGVFLNAFAGGWISVTGSDAADPVVTVQSSDASSTILNIQIPGMFMEERLVNGEIYQDLKFYSFATTQEIGSPALPIVAELLAVPGNSNIRVNILSMETVTLEGYNVLPFQTPTTDDKEAAPFTINQEVYNLDAFYPVQQIETGGFGIMRDLRVIPVRICPFQYNPVTDQLQAAVNMTVEIEYYGTGDNPKELPQSVNPRINKWYNNSIVNYSWLNIPVDSGTDEFLVKYLFIVPDNNAMQVIQPLVDFRNAQGLGAEVRMMEPGFNTADQFHEYIHELYESDGLEYVMLIGDWCPATGHQVMPMYYWSNTWSDSWYTMVDPWPNYNNDYLADIAAGRIIYDNLTELQLQINKTVSYLTEPSTADNWAEHTLLVAHQEQYPLKYTQCKEEIRTFPYSYQVPIFGTAYGGAGANNQDVVNYLNNYGSGILNYRGHGSATAWTGWGAGSCSFTAANIQQLTNEDKLFIHYDVCCDNMDFPGYSGECFAESFMKYQWGCVAINGAIVPSYTIPNHDYDKEFYKAIYHLAILPIGYASNYANITVYTQHGSIGESNIRTYLWLGDSAIEPWTLTPAPLSVTHLPVFYIGMSTLDVTVMKQGAPVDGAMVCGQNSELWAVGYTNPAGQVTLEFDQGATLPGDLTLTVTCHNGLPYQFDIPIIPPSGPYVIYNNVEINDAAGNNNGMLDFGEDVLLTISIENVGIETADSVVVTIFTDDIYTTIIDNIETYGDVAAGAIVTVEDGFEIAVAQDVPDMHVIPFTLIATSGWEFWETSFSITAHAPLVEFSRLFIDDATGNQNNQLDPGETADFQVMIKNNGSCDAANVQVVISTTEPLITIPNPMGNVLALAAGAEAAIIYEDIIADSTMFNGTEVEFAMDITADGGYVNSDGFDILVGDERYAPSGPDSYGYWAYDSYDGIGAPVYEWIEINPQAGGPGTIITLGDDVTGHVNLPFMFRYYGNDFSELSICSNGWVALGYQTTTDWSNSGIPNGDGPSNMVAPFWDDLNPNVGGVVVHYYDEENHRFIVEYYQVPHYGSGGGPETFQVILYDPAYLATMTGDGEIVYNYHTIANASSITVGIENGAQTVGLQFLYNGSYDVHAMPLENEFSIRFTTGEMPQTGDLEITLEPEALPIVIPAAGGTFDYDLTIENIGIETAYFQGWIDVTLPAGTIYGPLLIRSGLSLAPGASIFRSMTQTVPASAPAGNYTYWGHVGANPTAWSEDSFPFEKTAVDNSSSSPYQTWSLTGWGDDAVSIETPSEYFLTQNYPNPFNPETTIEFGLKENSKVTLEVYNVMGQRVATLIDGYLDAGYQMVVWDASSQSSGVYFYKLHAGDFTSVKKCIIMK